MSRPVGRVGHGRRANEMRYVSTRVHPLAPLLPLRVVPNQRKYLGAQGSSYTIRTVWQRKGCDTKIHLHGRQLSEHPKGHSRRSMAGGQRVGPCTSQTLCPTHWSSFLSITKCPPCKVRIQSVYRYVLALTKVACVCWRLTTAIPNRFF